MKHFKSREGHAPALLPKPNHRSEAAGFRPKARSGSVKSANSAIEVKGVGAIELVPQENRHFVEGNRCYRDREAKVPVASDPDTVAD